MNPGEKHAKEAMRGSMLLNGDKFKKQQEGEMPHKPEESNEARLPRVSVDLRIPLWGIASGATVFLAGLVNMFFTLQSLSTQVAEMQALLKSSSAQTTHMAADLALMRYRIEKLESQGARQ